jgi:DNA-directed RNA polymerase subunit RPC12/RpoP
MATTATISLSKEDYIDPNARCARCGDRFSDHDFLESDKTKKYRACRRLGCNRCINFVKPN